MIRWFICPDKQQVEKEECYKACRMGQRCMSRVSLLAIGEGDRDIEHWNENGMSASMAGNGPRKIFYDLTREVAVDPQHRVFALAGSKHHNLKEEVAKKYGIEAEVVLRRDAIGGGKCDSPDEGLWDYKNVGSYSVAKRAEWREEPSGEVYQRASGTNKKGDPKMRKVFVRWNLRPDDPWVLQLNRYRILLEGMGYIVPSMRIEATLRDGGVQAAEKYGFPGNVVVIPIPLVDNQVVNDFYSKRKAEVEEALKTGAIPRQCEGEESWEGRRCTLQYCEHANICPRV